MKLSLVIISILSLICIHATVNAQSKMKKDSVRLRLAVLDSLYKQAVPFAQLRKKYKSASRSEIICPEEKITLGNGARATYQTTDNKKITSILSRLFSMSPVDFLLAIRGIEGQIIIQTKRTAWVKMEDISQLMKLVTVDVVTPEITQEDSRYVNYAWPAKLSYYKTPMGINALSLINNYLDRLFPSVTPSYESVKTWYDSGKPKEGFDFEDFYSIKVIKFHPKPFAFFYNDYKFKPFTPSIKEEISHHELLTPYSKEVIYHHELLTPYIKNPIFHIEPGQ